MKRLEALTAFPYKDGDDRCNYYECENNDADCEIHRSAICVINPDKATQGEG